MEYKTCFGLCSCDNCTDFAMCDYRSWREMIWTQEDGTMVQIQHMSTKAIEEALTALEADGLDGSSQGRRMWAELCARLPTNND